MKVIVNYFPLPSLYPPAGTGTSKMAGKLLFST
jgi:hypothetical protein